MTSFIIRMMWPVRQRPKNIITQIGKGNLTSDPEAASKTNKQAKTVWHRSIVDKSSAYGAKGPGFKTQWRKKIYLRHCVFIWSVKKNVINKRDLIGANLEKNTIRATSFEKVFWPEKFPKTDLSALIAIPRTSGFQAWQ